jgi:hypothetical protein
MNFEKSAMSITVSFVLGTGTLRGCNVLAKVLAVATVII